MSLVLRANSGTNTEVGASDLISGEHYSLVKLELGALGVTEGPLGSTNPMPSAILAAQIAIALWGHGALAAAVPANAQLIGFKAATANPANATAGNLVAPMADKAGRIVTTPVNVRENIASQTTNIASTSETTIVTAGAAGVFNDIAKIIVTTAGSAAATLILRDATAGSARHTFNYPNAAVAPGSPLEINFNPPLPQTTAANNWTLQNSVATAINVLVVYAKNN